MARVCEVSKATSWLFFKPLKLPIIVPQKLPLISLQSITSITLKTKWLTILRTKIAALRSKNKPFGRKRPIPHTYIYDPTTYEQLTGWFLKPSPHHRAPRWSSTSSLYFYSRVSMSAIKSRVTYRTANNTTYIRQGRRVSITAGFGPTGAPRTLLLDSNSMTGRWFFRTWMWMVSASVCRKLLKSQKSINKVQSKQLGSRNSRGK